jgi:hypothetical protein
MRRGCELVPILIGGALLLAACGSSSPSASTTTSAAATSSSSTTTSGVTQDLTITPSVRHSLLDAAAAYHHLPASDYVGLDAGTTYYAFDPSTERFYAAGGLDPSPNSLQAQIGAQDDGAYNLFTRAAGASAWTVYDDGLGAARDSTCPIAIPAAVLAAWSWKANSCYPPS